MHHLTISKSVVCVCVFYLGEYEAVIIGITGVFGSVLHGVKEQHRHDLCRTATRCGMTATHMTDTGMRHTRIKFKTLTSLHDSSAKIYTRVSDCHSSPSVWFVNSCRTSFSHVRQTACQQSVPVSHTSSLNTCRGCLSIFYLFCALSDTCTFNVQIQLYRLQ